MARLIDVLVTKDLEKSHRYVPIGQRNVACAHGAGILRNQPELLSPRRAAGRKQPPIIARNTSATIVPHLLAMYTSFIGRRWPRPRDIARLELQCGVAERCQFAMRRLRTELLHTDLPRSYPHVSQTENAGSWFAAGCPGGQRGRRCNRRTCNEPARPISPAPSIGPTTAVAALRWRMAAWRLGLVGAALARPRPAATTPAWATPFARKDNSTWTLRPRPSTSPRPNAAKSKTASSGPKPISKNAASTKPTAIRKGVRRQFRNLDAAGPGRPPRSALAQRP